MKKHGDIELIFNFQGMYQQLESPSALFQLLKQHSTNSIPADVSPLAKRSALIEVQAIVKDGQLRTFFDFHEKMLYQAQLKQWTELYMESLKLAANGLTDFPRYLTLSDCPLLSLSYEGLERLVQGTLSKANIRVDDVQEIYPCTPLQEGIVLSVKKETASYLDRIVWECIPAESGERIVPARLEAAWKNTIKRHSILSTIFVETPGDGKFLQVLLHDAAQRVICKDVDTKSVVDVLLEQNPPSFATNEPEHAFTICQAQNGDVACRLDISHALVDAATITILVNDLIAAYDGKELSEAPPFREFIQYLSRTSSSDRLAYWTQFLANVQTCDMPTIERGRTNSVDVQNEYGQYTLPTSLTSNLHMICRKRGTTRSVFLQVAWALVLAQYTGMREACFGYLASGRDAPINNPENIAGPLINMLICRINLEQSLEVVFSTTNEHSIEHLSFQYASLAETQHKLGIKTRLFNTVMSVRQGRTEKANSRDSLQLSMVGGEDSDEGKPRIDKQQFDMALAAGLGDTETKVCLSYRKSSFDEVTAQEVALVLSTAIEYLVRVDVSRPVWNPCTHANKCGCDHHRPLYDSFFEHLTGINESLATDFWKAQFTGLNAQTFPRLPSTSYHPRVDRVLEHAVESRKWGDSDIMSTTVRAAWAILVAKHSNADETVFGAAFLGTESITGSRMAIVPIRIALDWESSVAELLKRIQQQAARMVPFESTGLRAIRRIGEEAERGCQFQNLSVFRTVTAEKERGRQNISRERTVLFNHGAMDKTNSFGDYAMILECQSHGDELRLRVSFDSAVVEDAWVKRLIWQFEHILRQLNVEDNMKIALRDIETASEQDLRDIWNWNASVPEPADVCVHDLISSRVKEQPEAPAICAWDGELTYSKLDELSTILAYRLIILGVLPRQIIPLYFEKSMWMAVAILAVMKAGATSVALDPSLPKKRISAIMEQVSAKVVLSSAPNKLQAGYLADHVAVVAVGEDLSASAPINNRPTLPIVDPSTPLYLVFTSGSTGIPKGAVITHRNFSSAIQHQQVALGFSKTSRVFDFASYSFDVAWSNILFTLRAGGCVCVPSNEQRQNDVSTSVNHFEANLLDLTPTVAREVDIETTPYIRSVTLSGEMVSREDMNRWAGRVRVLNVYGPAECTVTSTIGEVVPGNEEVPSIGRGAGLNTWVVATDASRLAPIGAIDELWLEGPLVGYGYLNDPGKTAAAFINDPPWILRGGPTHKGRRGRLYRTGDLVRYNTDGTLVFLGRKDGQIKIRGQRVELGEVEHNIHISLDHSEASASVVAELITPKGAQDPMLAAFVNVRQVTGGATDSASAKFTKIVERLRESLVERIPGYMIPATYIPIEEIPSTATDKIDRRRLREIGRSLTLEQLATLNQTRRGRPPCTEAENQLQQLWGAVLGVKTSSIYADDNFFRIGGDSIGAMRLVGAARELGFSFAVADVFRQPRLHDMATLLRPSIATPHLSPLPFRFLNVGDPDYFVQHEVVPQLSVRSGSILNVLPLAPYQISAVEQALQNSSRAAKSFFHGLLTLYRRFKNQIVLYEASKPV